MSVFPPLLFCHGFPHFYYECQNGIYFKDKLLSTPNVKDSGDFRWESKSIANKHPEQHENRANPVTVTFRVWKLHPLFPLSPVCQCFHRLLIFHLTEPTYSVSYCSKPLTFFHFMGTPKIFNIHYTSFPALGIDALRKVVVRRKRARDSNSASQVQSRVAERNQKL